ncbi:PREDICTED: xyloside xylosyltransferase 1 isoform X3 [Hipposideros armiger]|uniref:Xyloside xylosyltransferase 1 isoform X3 n=1 Tax=Hipposideros armiger TaxID=186990 RepID=A0A8B7RY02_HIPAR|nr:PREDICTED: xyloside xylosyltransferase 1 isoform X3 [Hipposideros armiger]
MGLLRGGLPCARAMARLGAVRSHYCALLLAAALAVCAFYYLGSGRETFSSATKRLKEARAGVPAAPSPPAPELARGSLAPMLGAKAKSLEVGGTVPVDYHLLMMFTKAEHNAALQAKARVALRSLLRLAKFEAHEVLNLHFVSEEASREVAKALLRELLPPAAGFKCKVVFHDVAVLTDKLFPIVEAMQKHFSAGSGTYYSDSIFFLSVAMHQIMPKEEGPGVEDPHGAHQSPVKSLSSVCGAVVREPVLDGLEEENDNLGSSSAAAFKSRHTYNKIPRIIQLDLDLKYKTNIRELFEEFDNFLPGAIIGIAREMQPVYSTPSLSKEEIACRPTLWECCEV